MENGDLVQPGCLLKDSMRISQDGLRVTWLASVNRLYSGSQFKNKIGELTGTQFSVEISVRSVASVLSVERR